MPTYFVGNVLPTKDNAKPEGDTTFDFTDEEASRMDLRGIPVRVEHEDGLSVGKIVRDWTQKDGSKWVVGKLDNSNLESRYANHAIQPSSDGHTLYKGLSLQHVHTTYRNGSTSKRGIEVSLCQEPRRPTCNIHAVNPSTKMEYIVHAASAHNQAPMSAPSETSPAPAETTPAEEPVEQTEAVNSEQPGQSSEDLMRLVVDQESELSDTKTALEKAQEELQKLKDKWQERENNERLATKSKAEALSKALVESWEASLPQDMMTDENKKAIFALAQKFPQESVKMMEIAHKASKKYAQDVESMKAKQANAERARLEQQVANVVTKRRRVEPETTSVVHAASAKAAPAAAPAHNPYAFSSASSSSALDNVRSNNPQLFEALQGFSRGNLRDQMDAIARIQNN